MEQMYLPHLSDPLRRQIAVEYLQHELRKLFPDLRSADSWQTIDRDVSQWFSGNPELAPVRDFWNGFHGLACGFKLKNLLPWLTSQNIIWAEEEIEIDKLSFGNIFKTLKHFKEPPTVLEVKEYLNNSNETVKKEVKDGLAEHLNNSAVREHYHLLVVQEKDKLKVIDGSRRLLKAVLEESQSVLVFVGRVKQEPKFFETWVPTSVLLELVWMHQREFSLLSKNTKTIARSIVLLIKNSQAGQYEFFNRCLNGGRVDQTLARAVKKIL